MQNITRRDFLKGTAASVASIALAGIIPTETFAEGEKTMSKVYFTREIGPESLVRIYEAMGRKLTGKVAVKISTGESAKSNHLRPELIGELVQKLDGTIVECCTAYGGNRQNVRKHWQAIEERGYKEIADVELMDEFGEFSIPVKGGFHLEEDIVGSGLKNYDSVLILSHFKGHAMAGMGGAMKNISIGIGSSRGKANIHTAGKTSDTGKLWSNIADQDDFLESMADACKAVIGYIGAENMLYINVANNLSVDCDCDGNPKKPEMADLGIFASTDPVALDQACYDAVVNAADPGKKALIRRMEDKHAIHIVEAAAELGLGSREYEIVEI